MTDTQRNTTKQDQFEQDRITAYSRHFHINDCVDSSMLQPMVRYFDAARKVTKGLNRRLKELTGRDPDKELNVDEFVAECLKATVIDPQHLRANITHKSLQGLGPGFEQHLVYSTPAGLYVGVNKVCDQGYLDVSPDPESTEKSIDKALITAFKGILSCMVLAPIFNGHAVIPSEEEPTNPIRIAKAVVTAKLEDKAVIVSGALQYFVSYEQLLALYKAQLAQLEEAAAASTDLQVKLTPEELAKYSTNDTVRS